MSQTQVLIIDDDVDIRRLLTAFLVRSGYQVQEAGDATEGLRLVGTAAPDVVLLDLNLPDRPGLEVLRSIRATADLVCVIVITGHGTVETAVQALKDGADNFVSKPLDFQVLLALLRKAEESLLLRRQLVANAEPKGAAARFARTRSPLIRRIAEVLPQIAGSDGNVLVTGESGTGKSLLARAIHELSLRENKPFIELNCASLSRELLESELFGHAAGAFTGAIRSKAGLIEVADQGTLFLDEIGDMDVQVQPKLLKAIEDRQIRRLGSTEGHRVDVRIIAATHFDLEAAVRANRFRSDLYFRLDVLRIHLPPLRERREDIPELAKDFLQSVRSGAQPIRGFGEDVLDWLKDQPWPGNLRELRNVIERAAIYATDGMIRLSNLSISGALPRSMEAADAPDEDLSLQAAEARHLARVLRRTKGNKSEAARVLGITRQTLLRKMRQYKLPDAAPASV